MNDEREETNAHVIAAQLARGLHEYGWYGGRANDLDDRRCVAFPIESVESSGDQLTFRFAWKGAVVSGALWGRSFTGTWRQSTGDGEVALEFTPDFESAEGWWAWPHEPARHRAFIRLRPRAAAPRDGRRPPE